jgi:hypothetical protein
VERLARDVLPAFETTTAAATAQTEGVSF